MWHLFYQSCLLCLGSLGAIYEDVYKRQVYIPLTVSSTLAVYDSSLKGLDLTDGKDVMPVGSVVRE